MPLCSLACVVASCSLSKLPNRRMRSPADGSTAAQFARLYPLGQTDLPVERKQVDFGPLFPQGVRIENPSRDYTPPSAPCTALPCA